MNIFITYFYLKRLTYSWYGIGELALFFGSFVLILCHGAFSNTRWTYNQPQIFFHQSSQSQSVWFRLSFEQLGWRKPLMAKIKDAKNMSAYSKVFYISLTTSRLNFSCRSPSENYLIHSSHVTFSCWIDSRMSDTNNRLSWIQKSLYTLHRRP